MGRTPYMRGSHLAHISKLLWWGCPLIDNYFAFSFLDCTSTMEFSKWSLLHWILMESSTHDATSATLLEFCMVFVHSFKVWRRNPLWRRPHMLLRRIHSLFVKVDTWSTTWRRNRTLWCHFWRIVAKPTPLSCYRWLVSWSWLIESIIVVFF